ncbi:MAG TPA: hypothetical protein VIK22_14635 [Candidatus Anoxymicrobiaceae bacterium]
MLIVRRLMRDERGQILRHVVTLGIIFAVIILVLVEVGPILWLRFFSTVEEADDLANAAAYQYKTFKSEADATTEVVSKMKTMGFSDDEITQSTLLFLPPGPVDKTSVRMTVVRYANTLIIRHVAALKKLARVSTTKEVQISAANEKQ